MWKSGSFNNLVKNKATVDAYGYVISKHSGCLRVNASALCAYYISAWASALLVSTRWAMPEPLHVGRVTGQIPTLFYFKYPLRGCGGESGTAMDKNYEKVFRKFGYAAEPVGS